MSRRAYVSIAATLGMVLAIAMALIAGPAYAAQGTQFSPDGRQAPSASTVLRPATVTGQIAPQDIVSCSIDSYTPLYFPSNGYIWGHASFLGCNPHNPAVCSVQADLEVFNAYYDTWNTVASGPTSYSCNGSGSTATYPCSDSPSTATYRVSAIFTMVEDGQTTVEWQPSPTASFHCV